MIKAEHASLKGIKTYAFNSMDEFVEQIEGYSGALVAVNAEKIMNAGEYITEFINRNVGYPDGVGAVMGLKKKNLNSIKIAGADLWLEIVKRYYKEKSFYLLGAKEEVISEAVNKLKSEFSGINICGYRNGYFKENEKQIIIDEIASLKPDFTFIALGSPKQELLMDDLLKLHPGVYMGLGGSFDVYTGNVKRAPKIFINLGLEWFYRLLMQPKRITRQIVYLEFMIKLKLNKI